VVKVGITGSEGLIGWHLRSFLHGRDDVEIIAANRDTFSSMGKLIQFVLSCDVIVHLAGMNRGDEQVLFSTNVGLVESLIQACESVNCRPHIIFSSSLHAFNENVYGQSKKKCSELFAKWSSCTGAQFTNVILPHVFGECGKPFYNSVVSTFCFQLANGQNPNIVNDTNLELIHAQQVASHFWELINGQIIGQVRLKGISVSVKELLTKISEFDNSYKNGRIPNLSTTLDRELFNTYRSYLYPQYYPDIEKFYNGDKAYLIEFVKRQKRGQAVSFEVEAGTFLGDYYHYTKIQRLYILQGQAIIQSRKLFSNDIIEFVVSENQLQYIDIPTLSAYRITNIGTEKLVIAFWIYDDLEPFISDTFNEDVRGDCN
jgi:UDP-2-acetamido-2,6-beta-L-arabino-hexul-4-ose reductase